MKYFLSKCEQTRINLLVFVLLLKSSKPMKLETYQINKKDRQFCRPNE